VLDERDVPERTLIEALRYFAWRLPRQPLAELLADRLRRDNAIRGDMRRLICAEAASKLGSNAGEPVLLELACDAPLETAQLAVRALGRCGTGRAIAELRLRAAPRFGVLEVEVEDAVAKILARGEVPETGGLALVDVASDQGAVSLTEDAGAVSMPPTDRP
jgi:hypothetical protein